MPALEALLEDSDSAGEGALPVMEACCVALGLGGGRMEVLDEWREHLVGHIRDEPDVIALQGPLHDLVPRRRGGRFGVVHDDRPDETGAVLS